MIWRSFFLISSFLIGLCDDIHAAPEVVNVVGFSIKNSFIDSFSENSGHRKELVDGKLFTLDEGVSAKVANMIGEKLLDLERAAKGRNEIGLKKIIYNFNGYLLQMQGYRTQSEKLRAYVVGVPIGIDTAFFDEETRKKLPRTLIMPDGGGMLFWQAYVDIEGGKVEIIFNDDY